MPMRSRTRSSTSTARRVREQEREEKDVVERERAFDQVGARSSTRRPAHPPTRSPRRRRRRSVPSQRTRPSPTHAAPAGRRTGAVRRLDKAAPALACALAGCGSPTPSPRGWRVGRPTSGRSVLPDRNAPLSLDNIFLFTLLLAYSARSTGGASGHCGPHRHRRRLVLRAAAITSGLALIDAVDWVVSASSVWWCITSPHRAFRGLADNRDPARGGGALPS